MKPDGSDLRQVTHNLISDAAPNWAPGGVRLAFVRGVGARSEIYVIKADGTRAARRLTRNQKTDSAPAWSPNGRKIAFQRQWDEHRPEWPNLDDAEGRDNPARSDASLL